MTFAAPLFLIAALAAAIPIVLHMVNRQRAKQLPFSTLRFLKISVREDAAAEADSRRAADAAPRRGAAADRRRPGPADGHDVRRPLGQRRHGRGHRVGQLGEHGHDRRRSAAIRVAPRPRPRKSSINLPKATRWRCCRRAVRRFPTPASSPARRIPFVKCSASAASATSEPTCR